MAKFTLPHNFLVGLFIGAVTLSAPLSSFAAKISEMNCDDLIEKYNDEKFNLRYLAGLYANRNCKGFSLDFKVIPENEKRIYKIKFDELDPATAKKATNEVSETADQLKKKYKQEKDIVKKYAIFKDLRKKYRTVGKKADSLALMKGFQSELHKKVGADTAKNDLLDTYTDVTLIYARALWNDDQNTPAIKVLKASVDKLKKNKKANLYSYYFLLAKINEQNKEYDAAKENYDLAISTYSEAERKDPSFELARVEWNEAWMLYLNGKPADAEFALNRIIEKSNDSAEKSRARFFLAKLYKKQEKKEESDKLLNQNIQEDFFSFYALASFYELGKPIPSVKSMEATTAFPFDSELDFLKESDRKFLQELVKNEENEMSERACFVFTKNEIELVNAGMYIAKKINRYLPLFTGFAKLGLDDKKEVFIKYPDLIFPRVYESKVAEMSNKTKIPTELIYSIMKQESGFNPNSRSHADAFGLMQVIPGLAKNLAKKYKVNDFKIADDLYNPNINIELGTYELKDQVEKQGGQLSFVASAYNAGPNALKRWVNKAGEIPDMFEFIENIPYDETRTYVKIIARNMLFYKRVQAPDKEHAFPEEFIKTIN